MDYAGIRYVAVGRLGRPHGVRGEVRLDPMGGLPGGLKRYPLLWSFERGERCEYAVEGWRWSGEIILTKFLGVDDRDAAALLANRILYVPRDQLPKLRKGEYFHVDIPGLSVQDASGRELGIAEDMQDWGEYDMLFVKTAGKTWMVPVIGAYVKDVQVEEGRIVVDLPEGLGP